jgi:hypothetical protein
MWREDSLEQANCLSNLPKMGEKQTTLERSAPIEKSLMIKLQSLQSFRLPLEALYEALIPAQRTVLDRPSHGDHFAPPHGEVSGHPRPFPPDQ